MTYPAFDYLVLGLAQLLHAPTTGMRALYPYPELYHRATNFLALTMPRGRFPHTLSGLLSLAEQPLQDWWPEPLPAGFDPQGELIYEGALSEEAHHYLYDELLQCESLSDRLRARAFRFSVWPRFGAEERGFKIGAAADDSHWS